MYSINFSPELSLQSFYPLIHLFLPTFTGFFVIKLLQPFCQIAVQQTLWRFLTYENLRKMFHLISLIIFLNEKARNQHWMFSAKRESDSLE